MRDVFASGGKYLQMITYPIINLYPEFMKNYHNLIKRKLKRKVRSGQDIRIYIVPKKIHILLVTNEQMRICWTLFTSREMKVKTTQVSDTYLLNTYLLECEYIRIRVRVRVCGGTPMHTYVRVYVCGCAHMYRVPGRVRATGTLTVLVGMRNDTARSLGTQ